MAPTGGRPRQYPKDHKGPYTVLIRKISKEIDALTMIKYIHNHYKSTTTARMVNADKMRIVLENIDEANKLPLDVSISSTYRVYIPEINVETIGCIRLSPSSDEKSILIHGVGRFKDPNLPKFKILDVYRLTKGGNTDMETDEQMSDSEEVEKKSEVEKTTIIRVTFEGTILPEYIEIEKLLIPVSQFRRKQMFCSRCQQYNHTEKFCSNREICQNCFEKHPTNTCTKIIEKIQCIHCNEDHETGSKMCTRRVVLEKREAWKERQQRKLTYAEMLREIEGDNPPLPNENPENYLKTPIKFPQYRKRIYYREFPNINESNSESKRKKSGNPTEYETPPGFRKNYDDYSFENQIENFLRKTINNLQLAEWIKDLIASFLIPIAKELLSGVKSSLMSTVTSNSYSQPAPEKLYKPSASAPHPKPAFSPATIIPPQPVTASSSSSLDTQSIPSTSSLLQNLKQSK